MKHINFIDFYVEYAPIPPNHILLMPTEIIFTTSCHLAPNFPCLYHFSDFC